MVKSEQRRQKQLAKKRAKGIRQRRQLSQRNQQLTSVQGQMQAASTGAVHSCYIGVGQQGMKTVILVRRVAGGRFAVAVILLDLYCLGVKDAFARLATPTELDRIVSGVGANEGMEKCAPSRARKLVEGAIQYAASLGFAPHPDYRKVVPLWGDIDASECDEEFEFGRDGRPLYISGPHDSPARQSSIMAQLTEAVGEGNFHYVAQVFGDPRDLIGEEEDCDGEDIILED